MTLAAASRRAARKGLHRHAMSSIDRHLRKYLQDLETSEDCLADVYFADAPRRSSTLARRSGVIDLSILLRTWSGLTRSTQQQRFGAADLPAGPAVIASIDDRA